MFKQREISGAVVTEVLTCTNTKYAWVIKLDNIYAFIFYGTHPLEIGERIIVKYKSCEIKSFIDTGTVINLKGVRVVFRDYNRDNAWHWIRFIGFLKGQVGSALKNLYKIDPSSRPNKKK